MPGNNFFTIPKATWRSLTWCCPIPGRADFERSCAVNLTNYTPISIRCIATQSRYSASEPQWISPAWPIIETTASAFSSNNFAEWRFRRKRLTSCRSWRVIRFCFKKRQKYWKKWCRSKRTLTRKNVNLSGCSYRMDMYSAFAGHLFSKETRNGYIFCYPLPDEVRPSRRGMHYGMPFGYTLPDEVCPSRKDIGSGISQGSASKEILQPPYRAVCFRIRWNSNDCFPIVGLLGKIA